MTPSCAACTSPTPASTWSTGCSWTTPSRNCRSRVSYKGALQGEDAHAVWIGDVIIRAGATGTDTYEYNRNLVLTDGTRVDSVPNLEILTGEVVGAGHASATGRFDDEHLFYLMARGIPADEARQLVIRGFFGELIAQHRGARAAGPDQPVRSTPSWRGHGHDAAAPGFLRACAAADLPAEGALGVEVGGVPVALVVRRRRGVRAATTCARTPRCRCPKATSRTTRSSAGCTAPVSTCAPASPPGPRRPSRSPTYPVKVDGDDVYVSLVRLARSQTRRDR